MALKEILNKLVDGKELYFIYRHGRGYYIASIGPTRALIVNREYEYIAFTYCAGQNENEVCRIYAETEDVDWSFDRELIEKIRTNPDTIAANDYERRK